MFAFTCGMIRRYTAYPHYIDFENKRICDLWISNPYPFSCKIFMSNQVMIMGHPVVIMDSIPQAPLSPPFALISLEWNEKLLCM